MPGSTMHKGVRAYSDLKYNRLFTRNRGWNGGDGVLTVGLPTGKRFMNNETNSYHFKKL